MATKFTPLTNTNPMQTDPGLDQFMNALISLREMRKQKKDAQYTEGQRLYQQGQQKRTEEEQAEADQTNALMKPLLGKTNYSIAEITPLYGRVSPAEYKQLMTGSKEYGESHNYVLGQIEANPMMKDTDLGKLISEVQTTTGVMLDREELEESRRYAQQQKMLNEKPPAGTGGGTGGEGTGEGKSPDLIYAQAQDMNKILQMRSKGGYVINGVTVKAKQGGDAPAIAIKDADGYEWQLTNKGVFVWHSGAWNKANKSGKGYKSTKGKNLELPEGYARALEEGYKIYQDSKIGATGKSVVQPGQAVDSLIGDY